MATWRRRSEPESSTPGSRYQSVDPVDAFVELGVPRPAAQAVSDLLRGPVTDRVCTLLPGLETGTGVRWLWMVSGGLPPAASDLARDLLPVGAPDRSTAAALVGLWLHPISVELVARHDEANPQSPLETRPPGEEAPAPSEVLRSFYDHQHAVLVRAAEISADHVRTMRRSGLALAMAVRTSLEDEPHPAWGGWGLLGALQAFDEFEEYLPRPGRPRDRAPRQQAGAQSAGMAFQVGRDLMLTTALAFIDAIEPR